MAYYYINFKGLRSGDTYQLRIAKSGDGDAALTGASVPFVTEEDDDDDLFKPVRLQTGYIGIIDETGQAWERLISNTATDKAVTLLRDGDTVWEGFVQPGGMTSEYALRPQAIQVPVMCKLSALEAFDVEPDAFDIPTFAEMLHYILGKVGGFRYVFVQGTATFTLGILKKRVNHALFVEKDVDGRDVSRLDCLELLDRICEFWGWAAHVQGQDIYFLSPDYASLSAARLRSMGIPTKLVTGYVGEDELYHAWIMVYIDGEWHSALFSVDRNTWSRCDVTFASAGSTKYTGDASAYTDRYTY